MSCRHPRDEGCELCGVDPYSGDPTRRPRALDLFCGEGGAGMGYWLAGFDVVGVDIRPQPRYPFEFVQADAMTYPLDGFDLVHASPPCHDKSALANLSGVDGSGWMLTATIDRLAAAGVTYVVENVPNAGADMPGSLTLCGTEFGLTDGGWWLSRHRRFVSNVFLMGAGGCTCSGRKILSVHGQLSTGDRQTGRAGRRPSRRAGIERARRLLEMPWASPAGLALAIPPAYTNHIGDQLMWATTP